jgi:hypothetical protein
VDGLRQLLHRPIFPPQQRGLPEGLREAPSPLFTGRSGWGAAGCHDATPASCVTCVATAQLAGQTPR